MCGWDVKQCTIPAGDTWILDRNALVGELIVRGELRWDTQKDGLELAAGRIHVDHGTFSIGTSEVPMVKRATVRLAAREQGLSDHPFFRNRYLAGEGGRISIHGAPKTTWKLLAESVHPGDTSLKLHGSSLPADELGWRVGDWIGVATTTRSRSTKHEIVGFGSDGAVRISPAISHDHFAGTVDVGRKWASEVAIRAEVVNLSRNVVITMDHNEFQRSKRGLQVVMAFSGVLDVTHTRIENCGHDRTTGKYCAHTHLLGHCPECRISGNAIEDTENVGITIHGTHDVTVAQNVIWDARSVGIYVEDGNEMNNSFDDNVLVCSYYRSGAADGKTNECFKKGEDNGGFYVIGMTNNFRRNRIVGYNLGFFTPGNHVGRGEAYGKVCPRNLPFLEFAGNVNHDCERFGIYLDNQYPRQVTRDENGYVADMSTCDERKADGTDNGQLNIVVDSLEYNNVYVGQYTLGDVQFLRFVSINNLHVMYWKQSKNFADGRSSHVKDSLFAKVDMEGWSFGQGPKFLGPSGPFTFVMENVVMHGPMSGNSCAICTGQHCGLQHYNDELPGTLCQATYVLDNVDMSGVSTNNGRYIGFNISVWIG